MKNPFKRKNNDSGRRPQPSGTANVFSYYASRSPGDSSSGRQNNRPNSNNRRKLNWQMLPIIIATGAIFVSIAYLLWIDINPRIEVITTSPNQEAIMQNAATYQKAAQKLLAKSPWNRLKLTIDTNKVADKLKAQFPELSEVVITTPLVGHRLIFKIQPTTPALALSPTAGNFVILDERGRALFQTDEAERISKLNVPLVMDESGVHITVGNNVLPAESVRFITEVIKQLQAKEIAHQNIILPSVANELHVRPLGQRYYVKFNIVGDARLQAGSFIATKQRLEKEGKTPSIYIDVRTKEKVYYQ